VYQLTEFVYDRPAERYDLTFSVDFSEVFACKARCTSFKSGISINITIMTSPKTPTKVVTKKNNHFHDLAQDARVLTIGKHLRSVRKTVYRESLLEFSVRLNVCVNTLRKMESGHPGVAIATWFQAFTLMQVATDVLEATRPEALLLASQLPRTVVWNTGK
jgi:hypothetical protein